MGSAQFPLTNDVAELAGKHIENKAIQESVITSSNPTGVWPNSTNLSPSVFENKLAINSSLSSDLTRHVPVSPSAK